MVLCFWFITESSFIFVVPINERLSCKLLKLMYNWIVCVSSFDAYKSNITAQIIVVLLPFVVTIK